MPATPEPLRHRGWRSHSPGIGRAGGLTGLGGKFRLFVATRRDRIVGVRNDGWMLSAPSLQELDQLVRNQQPALILELGSGRSTVVLADAAATYAGRLVSLEHDPRYYQRTRRRLRGHADVDLRIAPLQGGWYARHAWSDLEGVDLLIVDGPPNLPDDPTNRRAPAMPLLADRLSEQATVVVDDTHRAEEHAMLQEWIRDYAIEIVREVGHCYGDGRSTILRRSGKKRGP